MVRRVRGEQPLPGAPELLLQATEVITEVPPGTWERYLALSVTVMTDGSWKVHKMRLDPGTNRVITERLDGDDSLALLRLSAEELLRYHAHELVLGSWDLPG